GGQSLSMGPDTGQSLLAAFRCISPSLQCRQCSHRNGGTSAYPPAPARLPVAYGGQEYLHDRPVLPFHILAYRSYGTGLRNRYRGDCHPLMAADRMPCQPFFPETALRL